MQEITKTAYVALKRKQIQILKIIKMKSSTGTNFNFLKSRRGKFTTNPSLKTG